MQFQIGNSRMAVARQGGASFKHGPLDRWPGARDLFLAAVDGQQRATVARLLRQPRSGGLGLRMWVRSLFTQSMPLPDSLPRELVQVYLDDPEAVPLHDCADCGLAIPVRPGWQGFEGDPERIYFDSCPSCGGRTGLYAYWANTNRR